MLTRSIRPIWNFPTLISFILLFSLTPVHAEVRSLELIDIYATTPAMEARIGFFGSGEQIDLIYIFDLYADSNEITRLTWDVYNRHGRLAYSGERAFDFQLGSNTIRIDNAIPNDLGIGTQVYEVYASIVVGGVKQDTEFEIRIESNQAYPGVMIEDVRLTPRAGDALSSELGDAAIPYTLEIDFRIESIISFARAELRWLGVTADGYILDQGIGTTTVDEGFNSFDVDSYLARPPRGSTPQADFSVELSIFGQFDSVTFPLDTLPVSLIEMQSTRGVQDEMVFSVGEAYMLTEDSARASWFGANEPIRARLLTGGIVPANTRLLMRLSGGPEEILEDYAIDLNPGLEIPEFDFELPMDVARTPGFYEFKWGVVVGDVFFAERFTSLTISGQQGFSVPVTIDLPGDTQFIAPLSWDVNQESGPGLFATMITPDGVVCRILGNEMTEPLNVNFLADIFESDISTSGLPADANQLTSEESEFEGMWESERRAYLGDGKVFVHDYWIYRVESGVYFFLAVTSVADEAQVTETYAASDTIRANLDFGY